MTGEENLFFYWLGRHILGSRRQFQQMYRTEEPPGRISPGHLDRVFVEQFATIIGILNSIFV